MKQTKILVDGATSAAIFAVLFLISLYLPIIGGIFSFFLPLPMIYFVTKYGMKPGLITLLVYFFLAFIITGPLSALGSLIFIIPGYVIGVLFHRRVSAFAVMVGSSLSYIFLIILMYVTSILFFNTDMIHTIQQSIKDSIDMAKSYTDTLNMKNSNVYWNTVEKEMGLIKYFTPTLLVGTGLFFSFITLGVSYPILRRLHLTLPKWQPFREWKFPPSLLWYYAITFVGILFFHLQQGSILFTIFYNVYAMLELVIMVQGYIFIFYFAHVKKWNKSILTLIVVFSFLIAQLSMPVIRLLGIIDLGFNWRKRLK